MKKKDIGLLKRKLELASIEDFLNQVEQVNVYWTTNQRTNWVYHDFFKGIQRAIKRKNFLEEKINP